MQNACGKPVSPGTRWSALQQVTPAGYQGRHEQVVRLHAGLTGLLLAAGSQQARAAAPIRHLRNVNPYVAAALSDWRRRCGLTAALPLQLAPRIAGGPAGEDILAATSSFGMSGVNAHAMVAAAPSPMPAASTSTVSRLLHINPCLHLTAVSW